MRNLVYIAVVLLLCIGWWLVLPDPLFNVSYSTVLLDRDNKILGATVAGDDQFRYSKEAILPPKYIMAVMAFEDKRFFQHRGVDWLALGRAFYRNLRAGRVVSGGSTLSMQVIRISRGNPPRTYWEKFVEVMLTLRMEQSIPKYRVLQLYATHAPFGGNIVGLWAASEKYFNRQPDQLSWGEAAFLAVLPNAPSLKDGGLLKRKRDRLLTKLYRSNWIKEDDYRLALAEKVPERTCDMVCPVPHLLAQASLSRSGQICRSTIDRSLQEKVNEIVERHSRLLAHNQIFNMAVLVGHIPTGEIRAYVGNNKVRPGSRGNKVDIITSVRSSGSILKPALYALMQENGYILPHSLVSDIPSRFGKYNPSNFNRSFQGSVPASQALALSLNIPFVRLLKDYNYSRFYEDLQHLGIHSLNRPAADYGLSLILGGAETSLWDVCNMYAGMVSTLRHYNEQDGQYFWGEYERLHVWREGRKSLAFCRPGEVPLSASSIWWTLKVLQEVERPELESGWKNFVSRMNLSWKTGTSFGFKDAWAVGVNADWVVGVWVGNADGEGRPGLVGVRAAAPVLFEVAGLLPVSGSLYFPGDELKEVVVCRKSGFRASGICPEKDTLKVCRNGERTRVCPYHRLLHLDETGKWQVNSDCESVYRMQTLPWFVLPPVEEWYYTRTHADYQRLPPYRSDCQGTMGDMIGMIYPQPGVRVFLPKDFGGRQEKIVFEAVHRQPSACVYWHVDDQYIGMSRHIHQMEVQVKEGRHRLTLTDGEGNMLKQSFLVVGK